MRIQNYGTAITVVVEPQAADRVTRFLEGIDVRFEVLLVVEDDFWPLGVKDTYKEADALYTAEWWKRFEQMDKEGRPYGRLPGSPHIADQIAAYKNSIEDPQDRAFAPSIEIYPVIYYDGKPLRA